jgi:hypothetical protein
MSSRARVSCSMVRCFSISTLIPGQASSNSAAVPPFAVQLLNTLAFIRSSSTLSRSACSCARLASRLRSSAASASRRLSDSAHKLLHDACRRRIDLLGSRKLYLQLVYPKKHSSPVLWVLCSIPCARPLALDQPSPPRYRVPTARVPPRAYESRGACDREPTHSHGNGLMRTRHPKRQGSAVSKKTRSPGALKRAHPFRTPRHQRQAFRLS